MRIPSLAEPRSGRKLKGRHVVLFGAGMVNETGEGWSLRQVSDFAYGVGKAAALVYARHGEIVTCVDIDLDTASASAELIHRERGQANAKSVYLTSKWTLPVMEKQPSGAIIDTSSFAAQRFNVPWIGYAASKGGVNAMTKSIAAQYAPKGIRCSAIAPALLSTPMVQSAHKDNHDGLACMMRTRDESVPMRWQGEGWDGGEAAAILVSDEAASSPDSCWWSMGEVGSSCRASLGSRPDL